ncbi:uncharacterized protein [Physcomitrium patens]|uniref:uncharacterized protein isoform X3 n=2 Tax=Physcomitrium patens TaxID=3218 RepID=UPI003CCDEF7E
MTESFRWQQYRFPILFQVYSAMSAPGDVGREDFSVLWYLSNLERFSLMSRPMDCEKLSRDACMNAVQNSDVLRRTVAQDIVEEGSWGDVRLWNASDQQDPEAKVGHDPDWQGWKGQHEAFNDMLKPQVTNSRMEGIGDGIPVFLSPQLTVEDLTCDGKSGDSNDAAFFSVSELDVITKDGVVPYSLLVGTESKNECNGGVSDERNSVRKSGDTTEFAELYPSGYSSDNAEDLRTQQLYVQLSREPRSCIAGVSAVPISNQSNNLEDGVACDVSTSSPPVCEAQEGQCGTGEAIAVSKVCESGVSFVVALPPTEATIEITERQRAVQSFEIVEEGSRFSNVNIEDNGNVASWLQAPQARGKALVRRGRPRPWSAESREATRKRVKIDEQYGDPSPCMELTNASLQDGIAKSESADQAHDSTILEPSSLAGMSAEPSVFDLHADNEQTPISVTMVGSDVVDRIEIPVKAEERFPRVTRCGGITLHGNQCTHNVKDGSGFCVKHTKHIDIEYSQKTYLDGSSTSNRGVMYTSHKPADMIVFRCRGKTLQGTQCTHNVKDGAAYCLKHGDQDWGPPPKRTELPGLAIPQDRPVQTLVLPAQVPNPTIDPVPIQMPRLLAAPASPKDNDDGAAVPRCIGRTRRTEEQCSFRPKSGSLFCERHARQFREKGKGDHELKFDALCTSSPSASLSASASLKRRRCQEGLYLGDMSSTGERKSLSKAKDMFIDILNAGLLRGKAVSTDGKDLIGWICEEATKDAVSGETLLGLLSEEKERLRKVLIEERKCLATMKPRHFWQTKYSPHLARTYLKMMDNGNVCAKDDEYKFQTIASGRSPSDASETFESCPSSVQMLRQGSNTARGTLACALCTEKFAEMPSLGKHWKEDHKEEANMFQKGAACCECRQNYYDRRELLMHWKSTHPTLPIGDLGMTVCVICDEKFKNFDLLWLHVEDQHFLEFSSAKFVDHVKEGMSRAGNALKCTVCWEEFDIELEVCNHKGIVHNGLSSSDVCGVSDSPIADTSSVRSTVNGSEASPGRFKCKFCGQRFKLLPDLGRHHQAEHRKSTSKVSPNMEGLQIVEAKLPPLVRRTPLPNPATTSSPPGKMLPLSELCTPRPSFEIAKQVEQQSSVSGAVGWSCHLPVVAPQSQRFNFRHLKTIAREKRKLDEKIVGGPSVPAPILPSVVPSVSVVSKKRRRRRKRMEVLQDMKLVPSKRKQGGFAKHIVQRMRAVQQSQHERHGSNEPLVDAKTVSKIPSQRVLNVTGWPTSAEMLNAARVACCKDFMYRELAKKHTNLHQSLHLQVIALCSAMGVDIQWQADAFICPNQCSPFHAAGAAAPLLDVDMAGFSEAPFKAQAGPTLLKTIDMKDFMKGKHMVIHEDLSNGQEPVPIPCVIDEDLLRPCTCANCCENGINAALEVAEPWKTFSYINKRLLDPSLGLDTESSKLGCACGEGRCDSGHCDHVLMFDNDNGEACDKSGVAIKGRFPYDAQGRIILEEGYMVYECNSSCLCREDCQNRVLQKGVRVKLEVFKSRHKGWAVRSAQPIPSGTFVCEYIGEVVNDREANQRGVRYDQDGCSYLYDIDAHLDMSISRAGAKPFVIDATKHGNVARFINHSCAPNLINYEVLVESMDCQLAHIGFFANRDISAGEELAYDYRYKLLPGKGCACHCGVSTCRGRLY